MYADAMGAFALQGSRYGPCNSRFSYFSITEIADALVFAANGFYVSTALAEWPAQRKHDDALSRRVTMVELGLKARRISKKSFSKLKILL